MLKALIVDDEFPCRETIKHTLQLMQLEVSIVGEAALAEEGLRLAQQLKPDLMFLDIEMPDHDGFWLLEQLKEHRMAVVFVSAYDHYAVRAFRVAAVDYLVKPLNPMQLREVVTKCKSMIQNGLSSGQIIQRLQQSGEGKLVVPTPDGYQFLSPDDILWISAENNYSKIHLRTGKSLIIAKNLGKLEGILQQDQFIRIHKSYLINRNAMKAWTTHPQLSVTLNGEVWLEVAVRKTGVFMQALTPVLRSLKI